MSRTEAFLYVTALLHAAGLSFGQDGGTLLATAAPAPTATIFSNEKEVCAGTAAAAYLYFSGEGPWDAVVNDKDGVYLDLTDVTSPYLIYLEPTEDDSYTVSYVEDRLGVPGNTYGVVNLKVNPVTPVAIEMERKAFLYTEPGIPLNATPSGGTFTGNGVSANVFYPGIASPDGSPHQVTYTYYNEYGCVSSDKTELYVLYGKSSVTLLSGSDTINDLCDDGRTYVILGSNNDDLPGGFQLMEAGTDSIIEGHITDEDLSDDLAILNPAGLSGEYDINYSYTLEGLTVEASYRFRVNNLGQIEVPGLPEAVCSGDEPYLLVPDMAAHDPGAVYQFSGPGITGNQEDGFYFDPGGADTVLGNIELRMEYAASNGCSAITLFPVNNRFSPEVNFDFSPVCLPEEGDTVRFSNLTEEKSAVESWEWNFGDPGSGPENSSNLENPSHFYPGPGSVEITLSATTAEGCVSVHTMDTVLADQPVADFTWITDCFMPGRKIAFIDRSASEYAELDTLMWTFRTSGGGEMGVIGSDSPEDTIEFQFWVRDRYLVDLYVQNRGGCAGEVSREIALQPTIILSENGYKEGFNGEQTQWFAGTDGSELSWKREEPDFAGFDQVTGDYAWFTDLPAGGEEYLEQSWVQSPCFDFSDRRNPLIQLDLMKSFTPGYDGAVLQYQEWNTERWRTIGEVGEGVNWYNVTGLMNHPGESSFGWGLKVFDPDTEWMHASHDLDVLAGLPHVKLRIIVATGGTRDIGNDGFAFDNIFIGDRIRKSVLEHFTNSSSFECVAADSAVDSYADANPANVIDLQYHTEFPGSDPMNDNNPYPPSSRIFNYQIQNVPYALLNGGTGTGSRYDFDGPDGMPDEEVLKQASLEIPVFDVNLRVDWMEQGLEATTSVTCLADTFTSNLQLYMAVIETSVTAYTGINQDTVFNNVVLDMLPSAAGKFLGNAWSYWMTETRTFTWDYQDYVEDIEDLAVVAFVQNRDNGEILQAAARYLTPQVGSAPRTQNQALLHIYPNPASELLHVDLGDMHSGTGCLKIVDITGKTLVIRDIQPGQTRYILDISGLAGGIYLILREESGAIKDRAKLIVNR